jgi:anti-sigma factor RsiW
VAMDGNRGHLTSEQIQEFLDQQLSSREVTLVQEHLGACTRCQEEVEAWGLLFSDLSGLPELDPGPALTHEVLKNAPVRQAAGARTGGLLAAREGSKNRRVHIPPASIQDYLDQQLAPGPTSRLETHLQACSSCREQLQDWERVMESFSPLGHYAPSAGFAERVMVRVLVPAPVPVRSRKWTSLPGRALAWARGLLPETRHGWAVASGIASAPTITMAALIYMVFSRPLLTPGNLGSYLLFKGSALFDTLAVFVSGLMLDNATLSRWISILEPVAQSPLLLGLGGLGLSLVSAAALWVLYRNLLVPPSDNRYARARV